MRFLEYERCVKKESENRVLRTAATFSNREESDVRKSYDNASKEGSNDGRSLLSLETGFEADSLGRVASRRVASRRVGRGAVTSAEKCSEIVKDRFEPRPLGRLRQLLSTMQFPVRFPYANPTVID